MLLRLTNGSFGGEIRIIEPLIMLYL